MNFSNREFFYLRITLLTYEGLVGFVDVASTPHGSHSSVRPGLEKILKLKNYRTSDRYLVHTMYAVHKAVKVKM